MVLVHPAPMWDSGGCSQGCPEHGTNTKCAARCRACTSLCLLCLQQVFIVLLVLYKTCFLRDFPTQGLWHNPLVSVFNEHVCWSEGNKLPVHMDEQRWLSGGSPLRSERKLGCPPALQMCTYIDIFDIFLKNPQAVRDCCQRSPLKWKVGLDDGLSSAKGGGGGGFKMHLLSG